MRKRACLSLFWSTFLIVGCDTLSEPLDDLPTTFPVENQLVVPIFLQVHDLATDELVQITIGGIFDPRDPELISPRTQRQIAFSDILGFVAPTDSRQLAAGALPTDSLRMYVSVPQLRIPVDAPADAAASQVVFSLRSSLVVGLKTLQRAPQLVITNEWLARNQMSPFNL